MNLLRTSVPDRRQKRWQGLQTLVIGLGALSASTAAGAEVKLADDLLPAAMRAWGVSNAWIQLASAGLVGIGTGKVLAGYVASRLARRGRRSADSRSGGTATVLFSQH